MIPGTITAIRVAVRELALVGAMGRIIAFVADPTVILRLTTCLQRGSPRFPRLRRRCRRTLTYLRTGCARRANSSLRTCVGTYRALVITSLLFTTCTKCQTGLSGCRSTYAAGFFHVSFSSCVQRRLVKCSPTTLRTQEVRDGFRRRLPTSYSRTVTTVSRCFVTLSITNPGVTRCTKCVLTGTLLP